jgi:hypothetical protein
MKFYEARKVECDQWKCYLSKFYGQIELNMATIMDLKNGLGLGRDLKLSTEYEFNYIHIGDLLAQKGSQFIRPFHQLQ